MEIKIKESGCSQELSCIYTIETGKHEYNTLHWRHQSNDFLWIPYCPSCGWIDTRRMLKELNILRRFQIFLNLI